MAQTPATLWVADNACSGRYVIGPDVPDWMRISWTAVTAELWIDGALAAPTQESHLRGDPFEALVWTANFLARRGLGLEAGQIVSTGSASVPTARNEGHEVIAHFGELGEVRIRFGH